MTLITLEVGQSCLDNGFVTGNLVKYSLSIRSQFFITYWPWVPIFARLSQVKKMYTVTTLQTSPQADEYNEIDTRSMNTPLAIAMWRSRALLECIHKQHISRYTSLLYVPSVVMM